MTLIDPAYCSEADVQRLLSANGLASFLDHDQDGQSDDDTVNDCINQATEEINLYCQQWYLPADLDTSTLVNRWTTTLAAYFACMRRGNPVPDSIQAEFERIMARLAEILAGTLKLPGIALRSDMRPSMSNVTIDRRFNRSRVRVTPQNSTDAPTALTQDQTIEIPRAFE